MSEEAGALDAVGTEPKFRSVSGITITVASSQAKVVSRQLGDTVTRRFVAQKVRFVSRITLRSRGSEGSERAARGITRGIKLRTVVVYLP